MMSYAKLTGENLTSSPLHRPIGWGRISRMANWASTEMEIEFPGRQNGGITSRQLDGQKTGARIPWRPVRRAQEWVHGTRGCQLHGRVGKKYGFWRKARERKRGVQQINVVQSSSEVNHCHGCQIIMKKEVFWFPVRRLRIRAKGGSVGDGEGGPPGGKDEGWGLRILGSTSASRHRMASVRARKREVRSSGEGKDDSGEMRSRLI